MKGFREIGRRKAKLIEVVDVHLGRLAKRGIKGKALLKHKYGIKGLKDFFKVPTKKISGMISDLAEL